MKRQSLAAAAWLAVGITASAAETVTFDAMPAGAPPPGFAVALTGGGGAAVWTVRPAPDGAAGQVVVQTSAEAIDARFPLLVHNTASAENVDLSVRFRPVSGKIDQAAGLVWRYRDANNYYLVRANALEDNVVAYKVENGRRIDLPVKGQGRTYGATAPVAKTGWNTLGISARGKLFSVSLNGKTLYEVEDGTFAGAGKIGIWTKADSVMMFDDLTWTIAK
jgi:hypothetical protein